MPDWWFGDVGYVGPIQAGDIDNDHWLSGDNSPNWYNLTQSDLDDDGVGDVEDKLPERFQ